MKIKATIKNESSEWVEDYDASDLATPESMNRRQRSRMSVETQAEAEDYMRKTIAAFNADLRGCLPREIVSVEIIDCEVEDEMCIPCNATGNIHFDCEECDGNGWVYDPSDGGTMTCDECGGSEECYHCDGEGYAPKD